ncbi:MAG: cytochrome P450 [Myxococcota bacterium]
MASPASLESAADPLDTSRGVPHALYRRLRAEQPISRTPNGSWFLARFADVLEATRRVDVFRSSFREPGVVVPPDEMLISEIPEPRHGQMRKIVNSAVAAHRLGRVEAVTRQITEDLFDEALARDSVELVQELVMPIPTSVIAHLLGAPPEDFHLWGEWSDEVVQGDYPRLNRNVRGEGLPGAHPEFAGYIDAMLEDHRRAADPPDDFVTRLLQTEVDGFRLNHNELRTLIAFLLISGNETTRHLLSNLLWRLATDETLLPTLQAKPELIPTAVEESLRLDSPVSLLLRVCVSDVDFNGASIREGDTVAYGVASANRDETVFDDADSFRLDRRQPKGHVAFGGGPHVCPGASLARLEGRILLQVAVEKLAGIELASGTTYEKVPVFWANGPSALPARLVGR